MKYFFQILLLVFLIGSCNYQLDNITPPENVIPQDSFTTILKDMMLLESQVKIKHNNVQTFYKSMPQSAQVIFEQHKIDSSRFNSSMIYYSSKQNLLSEIYMAILSEAEKESSYLEEDIEPSHEQEADSIHD